MSAHRSAVRSLAPRSCLAPTAALLAAALLAPTPAHAQWEIVSITPSGGSFAGTFLDVTVAWCEGDHVPWYESSVKMVWVTGKFSETDVTSEFSSTSGTGDCGSDFYQEYEATLELPADGSNHFRFEICYWEGDFSTGSAQCDRESAFYTYIMYPDPGVSADPHNGDYINTRLCASTCFDHVVSYTTPAYFSLDQPRSVTLMHRSSQVSPHGFVQVDVEHPAENLNPPDAMSILVKDDQGATVTLANGNSEWFYQTDPNDITGRLSALWDMSGKATGAYDYTVIVRSWWNPGAGDSTEVSAEAAALPVRVLVLNEEDSDFGAGWSMPGLQRIHVQADSSVVVTEGDGSVAYFAKSGSSYVTPAGDFSTLAGVGSTWERSYPDGSVLTFDSSGRLTSAEDRFGTTTTYVWVSGKLDHIKDPADPTEHTSFSYDQGGKLSAIEDPMGRSTEFTVTLGDLTDIDDATGTLAFKAGYTTGHRISWFEDRAGSRTDLVYAFENEARKITLPTVTADGGSVRPEIEFWGPRRRNAMGGASQGTILNLFAHRPRDLAFLADDPKDNRTAFVLDRFRAPTRIVDAAGRHTVITRDEHSRVTEVQHHSGLTETATWTGPFPLTTTGVASASFTYDTVGDATLPKTVSGSVGPARTFFWGSDGAIDSVWVTADNDTLRTKYTTDSYGRVSTVTDPAGHEAESRTYHTSGLRNLLWLVTGGGTTSFFYDQYGRVVRAIYPGESSDSTVYNLLNLPTRQIDPLGAGTDFGYDGALRLASVTDAVGNVYGFAYNALGWLETETDPRGQTKSFEYDQNGNLVEATNRRGQSITFAYDAVGRLIERVQAAESDTTSWMFHSSDTLVTVVNPHSTDRIYTNKAGLTVKEETTRGSFTHAVTSSYQSFANRRTNVTFDPHLGDTRGVGYQWNGFARLKKITDMGGQTTTFGYDQDLQRAATTLSTGLTMAANYQTTHWNGALTFNASSGQSAELGRLYSYEELGRASWEVRGDSSVTSTAHMRSYDYDAAGRLTKHADWTTTPSSCTFDGEFGAICSPDQGSPIDSMVYEWDAVGNPEHLGAVVDSANLLTEFDGFVMTYDDDHNLLSKVASGDTTTFTWNSLGQLTQVTRNGTTTAYTYDGLGRRIRVAVGGAAGTDYVWDGNDIAFEVDSTGTAETYYAYYPGIDRPHSLYRGGTNYHYVTDQRGNVTGLMQGGSTRSNTYRYDSFGFADLASETVTNALRWGAAQRDEGAGLYYMRARYYDPQLQRFLSEDPIGLVSGINLFGFGAGDPVNYRDPSGLDPNWCEEEEVPDPDDCEVVELDGLNAFVFGPGFGFFYPSFGQIRLPGTGGRIAGRAKQGLAALGNALTSECGIAIATFTANLAIDAIALSGFGTLGFMAARSALFAWGARSFVAHGAGGLGATFGGSAAVAAIQGEAAALSGNASMFAGMATSSLIPAAGAATDARLGATASRGWQAAVPGLRLIGYGKDVAHAC